MLYPPNSLRPEKASPTPGPCTAAILLLLRGIVNKKKRTVH
jgi:hypothetical protein